MAKRDDRQVEHNTSRGALAWEGGEPRPACSWEGVGGRCRRARCEADLRPCPAAAAMKRSPPGVGRGHAGFLVQPRPSAGDLFGCSELGHGHLARLESLAYEPGKRFGPREPPPGTPLLTRPRVQPLAKFERRPPRDEPKTVVVSFEPPRGKRRSIAHDSRQGQEAFQAFGGPCVLRSRRTSLPKLSFALPSAE